MKRLKSLIAKLFGLKGFMWMTATLLLWYGKIAGSEWMIVTMAVGALNVTQKYQGEKGGFNVADSRD